MQLIRFLFFFASVDNISEDNFFFFFFEDGNTYSVELNKATCNRWIYSAMPKGIGLEIHLSNIEIVINSKFS